MGLLGRLTRVLFAAIIISLTIPVSSAFAHADLTSTNPTDGSELSAPPVNVELTFSESLLPDTVEIAITTESRGLIGNTVFSTIGDTVTVDWDQTLPGDTYQVAYRVVSNDGHPVTGAFSFSYPGEDGITESGNVDVEPMNSESINSESTDDSSGISIIWLIVIGLLIGAGIGYLIRRRS
jgi:methionine-rich copper-binding protein CopC